jgi:peroxiredoxin
MPLKLRSTTPNLSVLNQGYQPHELKDYLGQWLTIYFYSKDNAQGCTKEVCNLHDIYLKKFSNTPKYFSKSIRTLMPESY